MDISLIADRSPVGSRAAPAACVRPGRCRPWSTGSAPSRSPAVTVEWPDLRRALNTEAGLNALIDLSVDGDTNLSVVKDLQRDPVRRSVTHVDFMLIDRNAPLTIDVPLNLVGEAPKLEAMNKGMVDQVMHALTVNRKTGQHPHVDRRGRVGPRRLGRGVKVAEVQLPDGVTTDVDPEMPVAQRQRHPLRRSCCSRSRAVAIPKTPRASTTTSDPTVRRRFGGASNVRATVVVAGWRSWPVALVRGREGVNRATFAAQPVRTCSSSASATPAPSTPGAGTTSGSTSSSCSPRRHGGSLRK